MTANTLVTRRFRFSMFAALYVVQGVGLAYFQNFQKPYLDSVGVSADRIGWLTMVLQLPFVLKIFIGMLSDRVALFGMGNRKPYILLGLVFASVAFASVALVPPSVSFPLFAIVVTLGSFSVTLFDSTADGLAIDITPRDEQGRVQGIMVASRAGAFILLSLVFGLVVHRWGYRPVFPIIGLSMLVPIAWVAFVKEPRPRDASHAFDWSAFRALGQRRFLTFAVYAVVYSIGSFGTDGLVTFFMSQRFAATETVIGRYGALRGVGAVVGAIVGGALLSRLPRRRSAIAATLGITVGAGLIGAATGSRMVVALGLVWGLMWAFQETVFFSLAMDIADSRIAASMFAIMMGISNLGSAVADGVATGLSDDLGFRQVFWALALINLLTLPIIFQLFKAAPEMAGGAVEVDVAALS